MSKAIYKEVQRFRRWEVFALLAFILLASTYHLLERAWNNSFDHHYLLLQYALIFLLAGGALAYLLSIRLFLKIDDKKIKYQFYPLHYHKQEVEWEEVEECKVVDMPISAELSGWSVRIGTGERSFSVSGRRGLMLYLKDKRQLFIGSKQPSKLKAAIERCLGKE